MGAAGRRRARQQFTLSRQLDRFEELYMSLAQKSSRKERIRDLSEGLARVEEEELRLEALLEEAHVRATSVSDLRSAVQASTPKGAVVAVVSRGDQELLKLRGRRALHFPQGKNG